MSYRGPALAVQDDASATSRLAAVAKASPIGLVLGQDAGTFAEPVTERDIS
ncbi:MAG TPA: hypothetical protein VFM37_09540 [Pseudonocardiaceae bacterium]|nr:hypothetical protein [Pseudonocardiaceae bacterium]